MSATSGGGGSVSEGSEAGGSSQSTMSVSDSPSTSFQASLAPENVTKITLSEETVPGGYSVDVTGSKINLTMEDRQQKDGIVNVAFDYEEGGNRGGGMNGSEKKDKVPEAVNLELVNMVPYSNGNGTGYGVPVNGIPGIPVKKDSETVDMSTPYDEYFVPVNEHKKYMRGEKLYVTKDKRRPASWRRCLSWIVACTVISVVLIVAILAGTGVILSQEPDLVKDASVGRNFAGSNLKPSVTDKSLSPTAEKLMYVPRSIESEFVIDNLDYDPAFRDLNSSAYQQFATSMENQLKMLLFDKETLEAGASDIGVKVVNISRDPFKVNYRIGWNYKQGVNNPPEPIKMEDVKRRLVESLARNQGYIDKYHIDREAIKVNHVINACQIENGGCSHICYYNYITQRFTCTCPTHLVLDNTGKNCVAWTGSEDDAVPVPSHVTYPGTSYESTANPAQEYEHKSSSQHELHQGVHHHHDHGHSTDSEYDSHHHEHEDQEPSAEPVPEPTAEPNPGQEDKASGDFEAIPEPTPEPNAKETQSEEHGRGMHSVSVIDGDSAYEHDEHHMHSSQETSDPQAAPEPTAEPTSEGKDHDYAVHSVLGSEEPAPEPSPEPGSETNYDKNHAHIVHSSFDSKGHEPSAEPTPEPVPEPTAEPNAEGNHEHSSHESKDHEPAAEPTPGSSENEDHAPSAEPTPGQSDEYKHQSVHSFKDHEPTAEPNAESKDHEAAPEPTAEPAPEPAAEHKEDNKDYTFHSLSGSAHRESDTEPTAEPTPEGKDTAEHLYGFKDNEPSPEPTPEPTAEDKSHATHTLYDSKQQESVGETTTRYSVQDHGAAHSVSESTTDEPVGEPSPEGSDRNHDAQRTLASKDSEPVAEPTAEPSPEGPDKEHEHHSTHETVGVPEGTKTYNVDSTHHTIHQFTGGDQITEHTSEPAPEPTPEPSGDDDHQTRYSNTGSSGHVETTQSQDHMNSASLSKNSNEDEMQSTGLSTEPSNGAHLNRESESPEENKREHHVPYLQDILIRRPDSDSEKNTTSQNQNVLQNVEVRPNGEPVIEVLIGKTHPERQEESKTTSGIATDKEPERSDQATVEGSRDSIGVVPSTVESVEHQQPETVTGGPANMERSTTGFDGIGGFEYSEEPKDRHESQITNTQETTAHFNAGASQFDRNVTPDSDSKPADLNQGNLPSTTIQPERRNEFHTIPVAVEFSSSSQSNANAEEKPKQEFQTAAPDLNSKSEEPHREASLVHTEGSTEALSIGASGQTTTESHIPRTTLLTILSPDTTHGQSKETELHGTDSVKHSTNQPEVETTKSPEELSNNIKDELLDSEEFNTLLDKNTGSTDSKEALNKYPSKPQKIEKKKIKDYVKGEKPEVTTRQPVTPEDFILQKHVNGNQPTFDLDYSLQNEHTTKPEGEVTVIDPHSIDGVPGVLFTPHGINNHDLKVLQTVAPDFGTETAQTYELDPQKSDSKMKEGDLKQDFGKFEKDYKYEKQKVSKKKGDLKKKGGSGKDGKNVELDDGRKYFTDISKEDFETSHEMKDITETTLNPSFERVTVQPEIGVRIASFGETTSTPEDRTKVETTQHPEKRTESSTEQSKPINEATGPQVFGQPFEYSTTNQERTHVDQNNHQMIDEPSVKTTSNVSPGTVYDGQFSHTITGSDPSRSSTLLTNTQNSGVYKVRESVTPGTVFDGMQDNTTPQGFGMSSSDGGTPGTSLFGSRVVTEEGTSGADTTSANPTITINGQSGSLQDGHFRFVNLTSSTGNGTFIVPVTQIHTLTNFTTFPNGSVVQPTINVRGQTGTLQDGHEIRFGTFVTTLPNVIKNTTVYRIENGSLPDTVFDGHFTPQNGHYHMFSNSSGTFVYSNSTQPTFTIKGESGDFGNSKGFIIANGNGDSVSLPVIFRNSTVFAVGSSPAKNVSVDGVQEFTVQPTEALASNETIQYTRQVSPNFFSTGTAYKVNNYFGYISKCAAGQFQCVNGTSKRGSACISLSSKCDSINDCSDGSDELGCVENGCPGNFQCSDGSCLKRNLVCNGILDCSDGSDEKQCETWKCEFDEFQCPSGRCIPVVWQCDGKPDCDNHTDEYNCQTSCGNDEYLCPEGWCVPLTYRCNGIKECSNGEDEQLCDCSHEEFKCQTGGCVSMKQVCDGLDDCPDRSDEWDCVKLEPGSNLLKIRTASGEYEPVCADDWTSRHSDEVCASLGYFSSVPAESENSSSVTTERSFFVLKNGSTENFNKKVIVNLKKSEGNCSSGKLVEITCQEFSCGSRSMTDSSSVEARLAGGMSATTGQWPSVALLYNIRNFHSCTANVLTPRWVLASYNCLKMGNKNLIEQDWKFFGGSTVFESERENAETRNILSIIPHPQVKFNQFLFSNDLALVELDKSLQFTTNLGAVCLPEQEIQPRQICIAAGWGMNGPEDKSIRQQLQYLPVPTMNLTECNSTEHYSGFITEDKICAGYNSGSKSLCYNEEGAPLMCVNDRMEWELQGVLSYHSNCGRGSHPSIFSSITPVVDWIKKTIGNTFDRKPTGITRR